MATKLTKKQKGFVKDYVKTGIGSLAVKENYDVTDDNTARAIASENLTKPNIVEEIAKEEKKIADRIPDELLAERHLELLNKREVYQIGYGEEKEWEVSDEPDTQAVSKGLDMAYKLKGSYAPEKPQSPLLNLTITLENKDLEDIRVKYEEELKNKLLS